MLCGEEFWQPATWFRQRKVFDRGADQQPIPDQILVKGPQGAETEMDCGSAQVMPSKKAEITAEIVAPKCFPNRLLLALVVEPAAEFLERLTVITLGVN